MNKLNKIFLGIIVVLIMILLILGYNYYLIKENSRIEIEKLSQNLNEANLNQSKIEKDVNNKEIDNGYHFPGMFYAKIKEITDKHILVEGLSVNDINDRGAYRLSIKDDTYIVWRGTELKLEDLDIGDNIAITFTDEIIQAVSPAPLYEVKVIKLLDDSIEMNKENGSGMIKEEEVKDNFDAEKVRLEVVESTVTSTIVPVKLINDNDCTISYPEEFQVQKNIDGEWIDLEKLSNAEWPGLVCAVNRNIETSNKLNVENYYGELNAGVYRIGRVINGINIYSNEFEIQ